MQGTGMIEFNASHVVSIDQHVTKSVSTGNQDTLSVTCLVDKGDEIVDGQLQVVMNNTGDGYTVRVDDSTSGMVLGKVRMDKWVSALTNSVNRVNSGYPNAPIYVEYDQCQ